MKIHGDEILFDDLSYSDFQGIIKICSKCELNSQNLELCILCINHYSFCVTLRNNLLSVFFVRFDHFSFKQSVCKPLLKTSVASARILNCITCKWIVKMQKSFPSE